MVNSSRSSALLRRVSSRSVRSGKMKIVEALISDKSGAIRATWFNQPWIESQLKKAKQVVLSGLVEQYLGQTGDEYS